MPKKGQTKADLSPRIDGWRVSDKAAPDYIRKAYKSWSDQKQRCENPKDPRFAWWGAKGIKVEYSAYEFVKWYSEQWKKKGGFKRPNCSRIDHSKNYSFENIQLLECSENAKERINRVGNITKETPVSAVRIYTNEFHRFVSIREASRFTKVARSAILSQVKNGIQKAPTSGWIFTR